MAEKADAPYQIVKSILGNSTIIFKLVDTRNDNTIDWHYYSYQLETKRNKLNTDWFFRTYVGI